jgi:hypothetical protein
MVRRAVITGSCWSGSSAPSNGANSSQRRRVTSRAGPRQARAFAQFPTAWRLHCAIRPATGSPGCWSRRSSRSGTCRLTSHLPRLAGRAAPA